MRSHCTFHSAKTSIICALLLTCCLFSSVCFTACGKNNGQNGSSDVTETVSVTETNGSENQTSEGNSADRYADPAFLKLTTQDADNSALSLLSGGVFSGKQYTDVMPYGDRLLLIYSTVATNGANNGAVGYNDAPGNDDAQGNDDAGLVYCSGLLTGTFADRVSDSAERTNTCTASDLFCKNTVSTHQGYGSADSDDDGFSEGNNFDESDFTDGDYSDNFGDGDFYEEDLEFSYSFDLYDPYTNTIAAALSEEDTAAFNQYRITGDRLILLSSNDASVEIYDSDLVLQTSGIISTEDDGIWSEWYSGDDPDTAYCLSYNSGSISTLSMKDLTCQSFTPDYYSVCPGTVSPSGKYLTITGIEKDSLHSVVEILDTSDWSTVATFRENCYAFTGSSEKGFVAEEGSMENTFCYFGYDGSLCWYIYPGLSLAYMIDDDHICFHTYETDYETGLSEEKYLFCDMDGNILSEMNVPSAVEENGSTVSCTLSAPVWLEECRRIVFLASVFDYENETSMDPELIVWDVSDPGIQDDGKITVCDTKETASATAEELSASTRTACWGDTETGESEMPPYVKTMVPDPDSYDWGDLAKANERANELEETYHISIFLGPEVPSSIDCYYCDQECDPQTVNDALDTLSGILSLYPENFFPQLCFGDKEELRFYLTGDLYGSTEGMIDDPAAYVCEIDNCLILVADTTYMWDWSNTMNHEISHMIDRRLQYLAMYKSGCLFSDEEWCSFNPEDFTYMYTYDGYEYNANYENYIEYFIDSYGTTFPTEDRAQIFGYALECYHDEYDIWDYLYPGYPIYEKLCYYSKCIRDGFNTEGWPDILPWESYLGS